MPETPKQLHARAADSLEMPPLDTWESWPFVGDLRPKALDPRVERAVLSVGHIGKVHIGRWGEGAEHLHWWFLARPEGFGQLRSSFAEIWDGVLPTTPQEVWDENMAIVAQAMRES